MNPFLDDARLQFQKIRDLGDGAIAQVTPAQFFTSLDAETNSLALLVKHVAGNQLSRWRDFLTSDGEKPDRNRDVEFEIRGDTREALLSRWQEGWTLLFAALAPLADADLARVVTIRGEPHTVMQAINRQLTHYAYHVGQIVFLARHLAGAAWKSLSIPRGKSKEWEVAKDGTRYRPG
jgi:hypothetical protein